MPSSTEAPRFLPAVSFAIAIAALSGCMDPDANASELVVTGHCTVSGTGALASGDHFTGDAHDVLGVPTGSWSDSQGSDALVGTPTTLVCRINGSRVADVTGSGTWNGVAGYSYTLHVQDRGDPSAPTRTAGATEVRTLVASRTYEPSRWSDGSMTFAHGALVTVPASLPVTDGNAGNQWTWLTFVDHDSGLPTRCSYRGGASRENPTRASDIALGLTYVWQRCETCAGGDDDDDERDHDDEGDDDDGHHRCDGDHDDGDDDDGDDGDGACEWRADASITPGSVLDVDSLDLHVQNGSNRFPSRAHPRTVVTALLSVAPFAVTPAEADYYRLLVFDPAGALVHFADGDLSSGDLTIAQLP